MKTFLKSNILTIIGIGIGALAGYFYWFYVGCSSGTCAITSSPVNSTIYGSVMGGLLFSMIKIPKKTNNDISRNHTSE